MLRFPAIVFLTASVAAAASLLEQRIDRMFRTTPAVEPADVGIQIVQLATGKVLYSRDANKLLTPASNTKLFTTALAINRLGPDYKMTTRIYAQHPPGADGHVDGALTIAGGGDPSMSFIAIPFAQDAPPANPLTAIEEFADRLVALGIRSISGDIVGDDTAFPNDAIPPGWAASDALAEYGAPVSALTLGNNSIRIDLIPGIRDGDPAGLEITPPLEYFTFDNRLRTIAPPAPDSVPNERTLEVRRFGGRQVQLSGAIRAGKQPTTLWLSIDDPALYTATALLDALTRRGVAIAGEPAVHHRYQGAGLQPAGAAMLADRTSPPLIELLRVTDKVSQNLWAELMLRQVALVRTGDGSLKAGLAELKSFLSEIGIEDSDYVFEDGSGLSRGTLLKPEAIVRLLRFMYQSPAREAWVSLLPVGGRDGSLAKRFGKDPAAKNIRAKTGSLSHVSALSGYADSATYGEVAFSIVVNHAGAPGSEIREFIDKIGMIILE